MPTPHRVLRILAPRTCLLFAVCLTWAAPHAHGEGVRLPPPGSQAWKPLTFREVERATSYTSESLEGFETLRAESQCSASGLALPLGEVDLDQTPLLSWSWRVERGLDIADEREKAGDDFAARVYVMFDFDPSRASFFSRVRHQLIRALYGVEPPGSALNFVWTSRVAPGTAWDNPFEPTAKMIALERGHGSDWRFETVDIPRVYEQHFSKSAPSPIGLAVMSDSDNSCQSATAYFRAFSFQSRPRAEASNAP